MRAIDNAQAKPPAAPIASAALVAGGFYIRGLL